MSDLVLGMERELERDTPTSEKDDEGHRSKNSVYFSGTEDELAIFDGLPDTENAKGTLLIEKSSKKWLKKHLSASLSGDHGIPLKCPWGFASGDDQ